MEYIKHSKNLFTNVKEIFLFESNEWYPKTEPDI